MAGLNGPAFLKGKIMPSNADLIKEAQELSTFLGLEDTSNGLNNAQLVALISDLKAKKRDKENPTSADEAEAKKKADDDAAAAKKKADDDAAKKPPFYMADGKSITSKKGVLSDGDEVKAEYLNGGKKTIDQFVKSGHIKTG